MSDAAQILEIAADGSEATARVRGATRPISLALLTLEGRHVQIGDWVLICAGLAIERIDETQARELLSMTSHATNDGQATSGLGT